MITVKLSGGLGNQMFQYALARTLAEKHQTTVRIDLTTLNHRIKKYNYIFREFDLPIFSETYRTTTLSCAPKFLHNFIFIFLLYIEKIGRKLFPKKYIIEKSHQFDPAVLHAPNDTIISGYWQSPKYFADTENIIRKQFTTFSRPLSLQSQELLSQIQNTTAICVNFRRTDYVTSHQAQAFHGNMEESYYTRAVEHIAQHISSPHFFIFSDDIAWCKKNIHLPYPTTFVGHEYAGEKFSDYLQLMIACKHYIIPNSTFAWWAAWLSPHKDKMVIAPKHWFADPNNKVDIIPHDWIQL